MLPYDKFKKAYCRFGNTEDRALQKYKKALSKFGMDEPPTKRKRTHKFNVQDKVVDKVKLRDALIQNVNDDGTYDIVYIKGFGGENSVKEERLKLWERVPLFDVGDHVLDTTNYRAGKITVVNNNFTYDIKYDNFNGFGYAVAEENIQKYNENSSLKKHISKDSKSIFVTINYEKYSEIPELLNDCINKLLPTITPESVDSFVKTFTKENIKIDFFIKTNFRIQDTHKQISGPFVAAQTYINYFNTNFTQPNTFTTDKKMMIISMRQYMRTEGGAEEEFDEEGFLIPPEITEQTLVTEYEVTQKIPDDVIENVKSMVSTFVGALMIARPALKPKVSIDFSTRFYVVDPEANTEQELREIVDDDVQSILDNDVVDTQEQHVIIFHNDQNMILRPTMNKSNNTIKNNFSNLLITKKNNNTIIENEEEIPTTNAETSTTNLATNTSLLQSINQTLPFTLFGRKKR